MIAMKVLEWKQIVHCTAAFELHTTLYSIISHSNVSLNKHVIYYLLNSFKVATV